MSNSIVSIPKLTKENYDNWCVSIKAIIGAQDAWRVVEQGYDESKNEGALNQQQRNTLQTKS